MLSGFPAFAEVQDRAQLLLFEFLVPQVGSAVQEYLVGFTANTGKLTGAGMVGLFGTAILLLFTIEGAFNRIWRVTHARGMVVRLLSFWAVLSLTPLLAAASLSLTTRVFRRYRRRRTGLPLGPVRRRPAADVRVRRVDGALPGLCLIGRCAGSTAAIGGASGGDSCSKLSKTGFAIYLTVFPIY